MDVFLGVLLGCLPVVLFLAHLLGPLIVELGLWVKWFGLSVWYLARWAMHFTRPPRDRL